MKMQLSLFRLTKKEQKFVHSFSAQFSIKFSFSTFYIVLKNRPPTTFLMISLKNVLLWYYVVYIECIKYYPYWHPSIAIFNLFICMRKRVHIIHKFTTIIFYNQNEINKSGFNVIIIYVWTFSILVNGLMNCDKIKRRKFKFNNNKGLMKIRSSRDTPFM